MASKRQSNIVSIESNAQKRARLEAEGLHLSPEQLRQAVLAAHEINRAAAAIVRLSVDVLDNNDPEPYANAIEASAKLCSLKADLIARALGDDVITPFSDEFEPVQAVSHG